MSEEEVSETITAEFKDGRLQIVEVAPYDKEAQDGQDDQVSEPDEGRTVELHDENDLKQYVEVVDETGNGLVHLDLLNLTFVRCGDGSDNEYQFVTTDDATEDDDNNDDDQTMTCVLESSEGQSGPFVMVDGEQVMFLSDNVAVKKDTPPQTSEAPATVAKSNAKTSPGKSATPEQLLEKVKVIQKLKSEMQSAAVWGWGKSGPRKRGRKRASELPPPHELLASPKFKLYLYTCKLCSFNCNAIKELTAHRAAEHASGAGRMRGGAHGARATNLQCARCPYRASTQPQLMKHAREKHLMEVIFKETKKPYENLIKNVCGSCGFETVSNKAFEDHIKENHADE